ncbi:hypothetical protein Tco_1264602 [Tanacetum coccineum]
MVVFYFSLLKLHLTIVLHDLVFHLIALKLWHANTSFVNYSCRACLVVGDKICVVTGFDKPYDTLVLIQDLDTYDSDCDDLSTAQAVLMANISNYGSNIISEVKETDIRQKDKKQSQKRQNRARERKEREAKVKVKPKAKKSKSVKVNSEKWH